MVIVIARNKQNKMENAEEAVVHKDGSVTIRYYFGKTVTIPAYVMDESYFFEKYGSVKRDGKKPSL